jgi:hypothetical protein
MSHNRKNPGDLFGTITGEPAEIWYRIGLGKSADRVSRIGHLVSPLAACLFFLSYLSGRMSAPFEVELGK